MLFRVLGPVEVDGTEAVSYIGARKPRTLLATLLLNANVWVSVDRLVAAVWADNRPPASAERNVGTYIWQLRRLLPPTAEGGRRIESRSGAYRIRVEPGELDTDRFESLLGDGTAALESGDPATAVERLQAAVSLWRGVPFEGLVSATDQPQIARLVELHWAVREHLADALVAAARLPEAIALCAGLTAEDPLRESAWARLLVAYRESGRTADALAAYRQARKALVDELGIEPGAELQRLHQDLLTGGPEPTSPTPDGPTGQGVRPHAGGRGARSPGDRSPSPRDATAPDSGHRPASPALASPALASSAPAAPPASPEPPTDEFLRTALVAADVLTGRQASSVFADSSAALGWFDTERETVTAAVQALVEHERVASAWQLCSAAHEYVEAGGRLDGWPRLLARVATATRAAGERYGELVVRNALGIAYTRDGRLPEASAEFTTALGIAAATGDRDAEGVVLVNLAMAEAEFGAVNDAAAHLSRALERLEDPAAVETARQALAELRAGVQNSGVQNSGVQNSGDAAPRRPSARTGPAPGRQPLTVPAQLPADIASFAGREAELAQLEGFLGPEGAEPASVLISTLSGTAGIGKTALAVHFAHRVAHRFPDGQLYVNLRGFDPTGQIMDPADAVRGFLDALGVPPPRIPAELDGQAALFRSLLSGKRVLVLVDNARDSEQVRPLLPGSPGCLALVTSRSTLSGLISREGARPLYPDLLTGTEAHRLLERRLGQARLSAEPDAVHDIVEACAGLPLAMAIVAARAAAQPRFPLRILADELRAEPGRLDAFTGSDIDTDPRSVFSWSYRQLTPGAQRLFRLLGLHPGPDASVHAAGSLAGLPADETRALLAELTRHHLVTEPMPGRYELHDLLRAYAAELVEGTDSDGERREAAHRLLDHYLHSAYRGNVLLDPHRDQITLSPPSAGATVERFEDDEQVATWFTGEHAVLVSCLGAAAVRGFDVHAWQLAWSLETYLYRWGHWHDLAAAGETGLKAAQRLDDEQAQARAHLSVAVAVIRLNRVDEALARLRQALDLFARLGDHAGQARVHRTLGRVAARQERYAEALEHNRQALELFRAVGHRAGQALVLNAIGWYHSLLGDHQDALTVCAEALALQQELGDRPREAYTWDSLGYAHHQLGHYDQAIDCYRNALALFQGTGDRYYQATTLTHLGESRRAAGDVPGAHASWQQAWEILTDLGHPDADDVRAKLRRSAAASPDDQDEGGRPSPQAVTSSPSEAS